jgi:hypothetical protein
MAFGDRPSEKCDGSPGWVQVRKGEGSTARESFTGVGWCWVGAIVTVRLPRERENVPRGSSREAAT